MTETDRIKQTRKTYIDKLTPLLTEVHTLYANRDTQEVDRARLNLLAIKIQNYAESIYKLDADITNRIDDDDEFAKETSETVEFQDSIWNAQGSISIMLELDQVPNRGGSQNSDEARSVGGNSQAQHAYDVKLPKLEMITFGGDPLDWQEYWDSFCSSIHNRDMADIDKFKYLKQTLTGEAAQLVNGFRLTEANYKTVIDSLTERFGNSEIAVFAHFEQLLALAQANGNTGILTSTYDACESHVRSLVALGLPEDTFGQVFTPIILSKLPKGLRVELHRRNGSNPWTLSRLRELFREELKARQMGDWSLQKGDAKGANHSKSHASNGNRSKALPPTNTFLHDGRIDKTNKGLQPLRGQGSITCTFCKGIHYSDQCTKFKAYGDRRTIANRNGNCFKCLSTKHLARNCPKSTKCYYCSETQHHRSLCNKRTQRPDGQAQHTNCFSTQVHKSQSQSEHGTQVLSGEPAQSTMNPSATTFVPSNQITSAAAADGSSVHMQMAYVTFRSGKQQVGARIFFDPGSSCSYVTTVKSKELGLRPHGTTLVSNARFEDPTRSVKSYKGVTLTVPTKTGSSVVINAFVTDVIAPALQKLSLSEDQYPILSQLPLADWIIDKPELVPVDILIGQDHYFDFITSEQIRLDGGLILLGSKLGYITAGKVLGQSANYRGRSSAHQAASFLIFSEKGPRVQNLEIEQFWRLEDIGIKDDSYRKDDDWAVQQFEQTVCKVDGGRYETGWPWREKEPPLPDNYGLAASRLKSLLRKLQQHPELYRAYNDILENQLQSGIIERVEDPTQSHGLIHYLPHHAVLKPSSATTKVRIVHDASAKASKSSLSLNDCLLRGPVFLSDLCGLLLRFRFHIVAFVCDIEKAFFQVGLRLSDRDVTRFLWVKDPNKPPYGNNLIIYRFTKTVFGVISSPFLLGATIQYHLAQTKSQFAHAIARNLYVDNLLCGEGSIQRAQAFFTEARRLFSEIQMNLREWFTNSSDFKASIPGNSLGTGSITRVLGMVWDTETDTLTFPECETLTMTVSTKRHLVQAVSSVVDPCGILSPVMVQAKLLVQETWRRELKWDDVLPTDLIADWKGQATDLAAIPSIRILRLVGGSGKVVHLHCFSDASSKAYAAAIYAVFPERGTSQLIFAKSKLAPLKPVTLPRLELMAILIGARLLKFIVSHLSVPIVGMTLWSDSKCALQWLYSSKVLSVFVGNRVREIRELDCDFRYVPTTLNPADMPTRGVTVGDLKESKLWWCGPTFLCKSSNEWPENDLKFSPKADLVDNKQQLDETDALIQQIETVSFLSEISPFSIETKRFSNLNKLLRVTHLVQRYCKILINRVRANRGSTNLEPVPSLKPTGAQMTQLKRFWVSTVQKGALENDGHFPNLKRQLQLFQDTSGLWRCGGRLRHAQLTDDSKFPVLLPKGHDFTSLVIKHSHEQVHHAGPAHTLAELRTGFWVPCGRSQVQSVIHRCQVCRLWEGGPFKTPKYPPLPSIRVTELSPFECTGLDYLGPLRVKQGPKSEKVWICLFTCTSSRAIHLELVLDMTTEQFLLAFRRFVALYGKPRLIISDNAKHFKQSNDILAKLWSEVTVSPEVQEYLADEEIRWKFIPEFAPWMGGFYERLVGSVKRSLKKALNRACVTATQLGTIIAEVSAVLNTRPLIASSDVRDQILTPADLLGKKRRVGIPLAPYDSSMATDKTHFVAVSSRDRLLEGWKLNESVLRQFWDSWRGEYLTSLRECHRSAVNPKGASDEVPALGSVVLIRDNNQPRSLWKAGVISKLTESFDGICRSAIVRLSDGKTLTRPIKLLYPIEIGYTHTPDANTGQQTCTTIGGDNTGDTQLTIGGNLHQPVVGNTTTDRQTAGNIHQSAATNLRRSTRKTAKEAIGDIQAQMLEFSDDELL